MFKTSHTYTVLVYWIFCTTLLTYDMHQNFCKLMYNVTELALSQGETLMYSAYLISIFSFHVEHIRVVRFIQGLTG